MSEKNPIRDNASVDVYVMSEVKLPPRKLEIFISHAKEDSPLAIGLHSALQKILDNDWSVIWLDERNMEPGLNLDKQLLDRLDRADVMIVVFTGQMKESHGYTGWELGYFQSKIRHFHGEEGALRPRAIALCVDAAPKPMDDLFSVNLGISKDTLSRKESDARSAFGKSVAHSALERMFMSLERDVNVMRTKIGLESVSASQEVRSEAIVELLIASYRFLRGRKADEKNPQKKIVIELPPGDYETDPLIPESAVFRPEGQRSMEVFGLPEEPITWGQFVEKMPTRMGYVWKDVFTSLVHEAIRTFDVDNTKVILSHDGKKVFRIILTTRTQFYDERRELHVYLVEVMRRDEFGDVETSLALKALSICCKFRFMHLEKTSEFSPAVIKFATDHEIKEICSKMIKEMNLLHRESVEANLDRPHAWLRWVAQDEVVAMNDAYAPIQKEIRDIADRVFLSNHVDIKVERQKLYAVLKKLEGEFRVRNETLIKALSKWIADDALSSR